MSDENQHVEKKSTTLTVRIRRSDREWLRRQALLYGTTVTDLVREILCQARTSTELRSMTLDRLGEAVH